MAGIGPAPKDPSRRARQNKDPQPQTVLRFEKAEAPDLPTVEILQEGELIEWRWPARTVEWWQTWRSSPQAEHFSSTDWQFLLDTALIHSRLWTGDLSAAGELRLRVAKMGATMEDRARLRMVFADADEKDARRPSAKYAARTRYGDLTVLPGGSADPKASNE